MFRDLPDYDRLFGVDFPVDPTTGSHHLGAFLNEDWTHYSYLLSGHEPETGVETSLNR